jgi:histone chaperone ASF1
MQAALEKELADTEAAATNGDAEMGGTDLAPATAKEDEDAASDAGSEDLEQGSSDDEDEDEEEVGGDSEGDEDMEMGEGEGKPAQTNGETKPPQGQQQPEVTVH